MFSSNTYLVSEILSQLNYVRLREIIHIRTVSKTWKNAYDTTERMWSILHYEDILYNKKYFGVDNIIQLIQSTPFSKYLKKIKLCSESLSDMYIFSNENFDKLCDIVPKCIESIDINTISNVRFDILIDRDIRLKKLFIRKNAVHIPCIDDRLPEHVKILVSRGLRKLMMNMFCLTGENLIRDIGHLSYVYIPSCPNIEPLLNIGVNKIERVTLSGNMSEDGYTFHYLRVMMNRGVKIGTLIIVKAIPHLNPLLEHEFTVKHIVLYKFNEYTKKILSLVKGLRRVTILDKVTKSCIDALCEKDNITSLTLANIKDVWLDTLTSKFSSLQVLRILKLHYISPEFIEYVSRLKMLQVLDIMELKISTEYLYMGIKKLCRCCRYIHNFSVLGMDKECKDIAKLELRYLYTKI